MPNTSYHFGPFYSDLVVLILSLGSLGEQALASHNQQRSRSNVLISITLRLHDFVVPPTFKFIGSNTSTTLRAQSEVPRMIVYHGTALLARHDGFVFTSRITEANVDLLTSWIVMLSDAAVKTVVFLGVPACAVKRERVLSGCR